MKQEIKYKARVKYHELTLCDSGRDLRSPEAVVAFCDDEALDVQENLVLLAMNAKNRVAKKYLVCKGNANTIRATPIQMIRNVILSGSESAILVHNHPSGEPAPSEEDIVFTRKVKDAFEMMGIRLVDHIILGQGRYFSFLKEGLI